MYAKTRNLEATTLFIALTETERRGRMEVQDSTTQAKNTYKTAGQAS